MTFRPLFTPATLALLVVVLAFGCSTTEEALPPLKPAKPAATPEEVRAALPGTWTIDVKASAEVMGRAQFRPRKATLLRREGSQPATREAGLIADKFDPESYRNARRYWENLLEKPDMRWQITFKPDGTGEHRAIVETGSAPVAVPFGWRLEGWRLHVDYPAGAKFQSFAVEAPSAEELHYPMEPLGDYLVLRRE
jgi:hypothetical protein